MSWRAPKRSSDRYTWDPLSWRRSCQRLHIAFNFQQHISVCTLYSMSLNSNVTWSQRIYNGNRLHRRQMRLVVSGNMMSKLSWTREFTEDNASTLSNGKATQTT